MPAFTVSTRTPDTSAGEYGDTRLASGGCGAGGTGNRPSRGRVGAVDGDIDVATLPAVFDAGCLPFAGDGAGAGSVGTFDVVEYGGLGMLSGFAIWICMAISSRSCFSAGPLISGESSSRILATHLTESSS